MTAISSHFARASALKPSYSSFKLTMDTLVPSTRPGRRSYPFAQAGSPQHAREFSRAQALCLLLISCGLILGLGLLFFPDTLEDAYITFRYSKHLAAGYGFGAWNLEGARVEGYSSPLWMIYIAAADRLGLDPRIASKSLGIASLLLIASVLILFPTVARTRDLDEEDILTTPNVTTLAGLLCAGYLPLAWYSTSGMEVVFFSLLVLAACLSLQLKHRKYFFSATIILLIFTRPEGLAVALAGVGTAWISARVNRTSSRDLRLPSLALLFAAGVLFAHRLWVFGDFLPNTYYAKAAGELALHIRLGKQYMLDWTKSHWLLVVLCVSSIFTLIVSLQHRRARRLPEGFAFILTVALIYLVYTIRVGGDNYSAFPYWRHLVHIFPLLALLACYSIARLMPNRRMLQLLVLIGLAGITNYAILFGQQGQLRIAMRQGVRNWPHPTLEPHNKYYLWLRDIVTGDTTVASSLGGELPFVVDANHIDILGLNTSYIAKNGLYDPNGPVDSKTDIPWVVEQRPDVIEGYVSGKKIRLGADPNAIIGGWRYPMNSALVSSPIFQEEYVFVLNAPYDSLDRALFLRRQFWQAHPARDRLEVVPVADTTLAEFSPRPGAHRR